MYRRDFLAAGSLGLANLLHADEARSITFGFSLYGMRSLQLDAALRTCAGVGYSAVELAVMAGWPGDPMSLNKDARRSVRERLQERRLTLAALMENTPLSGDAKTHRVQMDRLSRAAELGHELSPKSQPLLETILGGRAGEWDKLRGQFAERLADWARLGEAGRTVIAIKPHRLNAMNTPAQALWLLEQVKSPWIQLGYDYSHFHGRGLGMAETVKSLGPRIRFVHVKDVRVDNGRVQFLLPGAGDIDYAGLFRELRAINYAGCVCVEVSGQIHMSKGYDAAATARRCFENLAPAFRRAGIPL